MKSTFMQIYADNLMLLSASVSGLQQLLYVCALTAIDLCLQFNDKKSHCIIVKPEHKCQPLFYYYYNLMCPCRPNLCNGLTL